VISGRGRHEPEPLNKRTLRLLQAADYHYKADFQHGESNSQHHRVRRASSTIAKSSPRTGVDQTCIPTIDNKRLTNRTAERQRLTLCRQPSGQHDGGRTPGSHHQRLRHAGAHRQRRRRLGHVLQREPRRETENASCTVNARQRHRHATNTTNHIFIRFERHRPLRHRGRWSTQALLRHGTCGSTFAKWDVRHRLSNVNAPPFHAQSSPPRGPTQARHLRPSRSRRIQSTTTADGTQCRAGRRIDHQPAPARHRQ